MARCIISLFLTVVAALSAVAPAAAQGTVKAANLSSWLREMYTRDHNYILNAAEKMPEDGYDLRPGPQQEVRTFGQILGHIINFNYLMCSAAQGDKNPYQHVDFEKVTTKAALVKALNEAFGYCDTVYSSLTEVSSAEPITVPSDPWPLAKWVWPLGETRASSLGFNCMHNEEHYGNLVTYLRIKGIVPPSSEHVRR